MPTCNIDIFTQKDELCTIDHLSPTHTHAFYSIARKESKAICSSSIESMSTRITKNQARTKCLIDREDFKHEIKREKKQKMKMREFRMSITFFS